MKADDLKDRCIVRAVFTLPDGEEISRDWTMNDPPPSWLLGPPPEWLSETGRTWDHPQDPIVHTGKVAAGHEAEARELLHAG